jgi:tRNA/rRNA methyltransferase
MHIFVPSCTDSIAHFTLNAARPLDNIRIVLVETSHSGNIGSAARAMKTMGLSRLYLVAPRCEIDDQARALASGAVDVLAGAKICATLNEALHGVVHSAACTSRRRDMPHPAYTPRQAAPELLRMAQDAPVALVFGSETFGLSNEQLMHCRWLINIPANPDYMSLNLASAVQVCAYELRSGVEDQVLPLPTFAAASHEDIEAFHQALEIALTDLGFFDPGNPKRLLPRLRRFFARAGLEKDELAIWRGVLGAIAKTKNRPD